RLCTRNGCRSGARPQGCRLPAKAVGAKPRDLAGAREEAAQFGTAGAERRCPANARSDRACGAACRNDPGRAEGEGKPLNRRSLTATCPLPACLSALLAYISGFRSTPAGG